MFGPMNFLLQTLECIRFFNTYNLLLQNGAAVNFTGHVMHCASCLFHTVFPSLFDGVKPLEAGQQTRMQVDDPFREGIQKSVVQHAHKTCQHNEFSFQGPDGFNVSAFRLIAQFCFMRPGIDMQRRNPVILGQGKDWRVGPVGNDGYRPGLTQAVVLPSP